MLWKPNRRGALKMSAAAVLAGMSARFSFAGDIPATPESGPIKMGIEPWLGYGQWHIAAKKGLFKKVGLDSVDIVNFTTDADINAALAAGQLQCSNIATHTAFAKGTFVDHTLVICGERHNAGHVANRDSAFEHLIHPTCDYHQTLPVGTSAGLILCPHAGRRRCTWS